MTNPPNQTVSIAPDPSYIQKAFEHFGIELGGAVQMTPTGHFRIDIDQPDYASVLSALTGQILADYALGTMVVPSNVAALRKAIGGLHEVRRRLNTSEDREAVLDVEEQLASIASNLDGLLGPATS